MLTSACGDNVEFCPISASRLHILGADVGGSGCPVFDDLDLEITAELRNVFVVGVEHSGSA